VPMRQFRRPDNCLGDRVASWAQIARRIRVPLSFAFTALYLWLAQPAIFSILLGCIFVVLGLFLRALASGHVKKNQELSTGGPYGYTRNPLYLGSLILAAGFAIAARSWAIIVMMLIFFVVIYVPVIRGEEAFLRQRFAEFDHYARSVPRLLPKFSSRWNKGTSFSWGLYRQHREYNALLGSLALLGALAVKLIWSG
jgi:protein-S-isoprenylcysteine O-methyltransferase Ste14